LTRDRKSFPTASSSLSLGRLSTPKLRWCATVRVVTPVVTDVRRHAARPHRVQAEHRIRFILDHKTLGTALRGPGESYSDVILRLAEAS
jgi:hypothetical protein